MDNEQPGRWPISRSEFVDESLRLGWKITSAASDHLILEASQRWQMTAWFARGAVVLVELFDVQSGDEVRFHLTTPVPAPDEVEDIMGSSESHNLP